MTQEEVKKFLDVLCEASAEAANFYLDNSQQNPDQMPEFVMSAGATHRLAVLGISTILEVTRETLGNFWNIKNNQSIVDNIQAELGKGKIDLVIMSSDSDPANRHPIGFVEFKKWNYCEFDAKRVRVLLDGIPGAEFGACVIMKDAIDEESWHDRQKKLLRSPSYSAPPVLLKREDNAGKTCHVVCFAELRTPDVLSA